MMGAAFHYRDQRPAEVIAASRDGIGQSDYDQISLTILISLDAAKKYGANPAMTNQLIEHLMAAYIYWTEFGNDVLSRRGYVAYMAMFSAVQRCPLDVMLTQKEYQDVRNAIVLYLAHMKTMPAGQFVRNYRKALERLSI